MVENGAGHIYICFFFGNIYQVTFLHNVAVHKFVVNVFKIRFFNIFTKAFIRLNIQ